MARAINASGQIVGASGPSPSYYAVFWNSPTTPPASQLGVRESTAQSINASGQVVGYFNDFYGGADGGFLYTGGTMYDLLTLAQPTSGVTSLLSANGINDSGQIAATGLVNNQWRALRFDPVPTPEPTSAALLLGTGALLALRRRR